jgi:hypothetical protein
MSRQDKLRAARGVYRVLNRLQVENSELGRGFDPNLARQKLNVAETIMRLEKGLVLL